MVEWLERLGYGVESPAPEGREFEPGFGHPTTGKLCQPSSTCFKSRTDNTEKNN